MRPPPLTAVRVSPKRWSCCSSLLMPMEVAIAARGGHRRKGLAAVTDGAQDHRVGKNIRHALDQATTAAIRRDLLQQIGDGVTNPAEQTLHLPGTPPVILRRRGDRDLEHIPPTELAAVARHILGQDTTISDSELKTAAPNRLRTSPPHHQRLSLP